jgi:hypothetical protein
VITLCYENLATDAVGYPNLARHKAQPYTAEWRKFDQHWPRTVPLRLLMYTTNYNVIAVEDTFERAWYPIGLGWFNFDYDYFASLSELTLSKVLQGQLRILFYYHEGDNPTHIKYRLDKLADRHRLPPHCYTFVSANTQASNLKNFVYFPDHEFFFRFVNRQQQPQKNSQAPQYNFTVLNRLPKWWRASVVSDLQYLGLLKNSLVSYNTSNVALDEDENDNPIEVDQIDGWRSRTRSLSQSQLLCDQFNSEQQNDHHTVNSDLYTQSKCSIVLETHFDVDQSGGAFLTEKTFKPIKYGQPFVIAGGPGSLQALRDQGYRVFDSVIDNRYDNVQDNTQRYFALRGAIADIANNPDFYNLCLEDVQHNQQVFEQRVHAPVNTLIEELECRLQ